MHSNLPIPIWVTDTEVITGPTPRQGMTSGKYDPPPDKEHPPSKFTASTEQKGMVMKGKYIFLLTKNNADFIPTCSEARKYRNVSAHNTWETWG